MYAIRDTAVVVWIGPDGGCDERTGVDDDYRPNPSYSPSSSLRSVMPVIVAGGWSDSRPCALRGLLVPARCAENRRHDGLDGTSTAAWPTEPVAYLTAQVVPRKRNATEDF